MYTVDSTKILINMNLEKLEKIYSMIKDTSSISIIKEPNLATVMVRANESVKNTTFNLGEILVTECSVKVDESLGYGIVSENNNKKAIYLAAIDAVLHSNNSKFDELKNYINKSVYEENLRYEQEIIDEFSLINKTKVQFNAMD
ncbi:TPA: phosphonate C-P lyase system protein PhnG [Clostridioides difficile]|uniref:phosphonate C-P lyase system protein PhnG n=1 Tax=Clostridioides difficile TaxID=1496 RepID=UPI000414EA5E|nr:phosphonate C-P lyase system protein PhnG [Clostridioides difficile]EGT3662442.1 phosphonate C-P lyase system protein PhnG [Clostridioides difficile]EGT3686983.1 phosphonate C-P lyase system protein PhnG [Clostridioides difficile]EGT5487903.1 phosphonate C-P lyase system protein PhnG [Clostridioides difficile]EKG0821346.1 phosphonate C-P lyase system protein PhnG [Clostridioides difficile]MBF9946938.1 phosphonate C-P lyase system protein PhnG [Clostridioides difficile]